MTPSAPPASRPGKPQGTAETDVVAGETGLKCYVCLALGFLLTVAGVFVLYPSLQSFARPLHYLATTALVVALVLAWLAAWTGLELLWR